MHVRALRVEFLHWPATLMERHKVMRASSPWLSHIRAERDNNDVAPCGAPSPLAFRLFKTRTRNTSRAREGRLAKTHARRRGEALLLARIFPE
jgi:hypothetical protein